VGSFALSAELDRLETWEQAALPALSAPGLDYVPNKLANYAGRIVLVHFFAKWCESCREEMNSLSALARRQTAGTPIAIVAVDFGEVPERVRRYLAREPVNFPILLDLDRSIAKAWGVEALPTTFVLGRQLRPRFRTVGDLDWMQPDALTVLDTLAAEPPRHGNGK
jgi:thiol-disulfide isomerase/thioredoxin